MSGTSLCVYLYDKTKTKAIGMKKVGFKRVLGDNTVWGWRLGGFGEKVAIGEGSVRPQVPGEMAPFIPPGITGSLSPLLPPSFSTQTATGRAICKFWGRGCVLKLETRLRSSHSRAKLLALKDTQHDYIINNHTGTFEKKTWSCYSYTENLPETSCRTWDNSEVRTSLCRSC